MDLQSLEKDVAAAKELYLCIGRARTHFLDLDFSEKIDTEVRNRAHGAEWALIMFQNDVRGMLDMWQADLSAAKAKEEKQDNTQQANGAGASPRC